MIHHEFVENNNALWLKGEISKLEAFASICPIPADQSMVSAFATNFLTATPLQAKDLDQLQRPPSGTFTIVRRSLGPLPTTQATSVTQAPECQAAAPVLRIQILQPSKEAGRVSLSAKGLLIHGDRNRRCLFGPSSVPSVFF